MLSASVIVPVYNSEQFLETCILSILDQGFKELELILVDDGSTDSSLEICKKYSEIDSRVVVISKENGGVASARNAGLSVAKGLYIFFVDSDDYLMPDYIGSMMIGNADIVQSGYSMDKKGLAVLKKIPLQASNYNLYEGNVFEHYPLESRMGVVWGKRFKKSIITGNNIKFNESYKVCEDVIFMCEYIIHAETGRDIDNMGYIYRAGYQNSLSTPAASVYDALKVSLKDIGKILTKRFKGATESNSYKTRLYGIYEMELYYILQSKKSFLRKYKDLKALFKEGVLVEYADYKKDKSVDAKLYKLIKKGKPLMLLIRYEVSRKVKHT